MGDPMWCLSDSYIGKMWRTLCGACLGSPEQYSSLNQYRYRMYGSMVHVHTELKSPPL